MSFSFSFLLASLDINDAEEQSGGEEKKEKETENHDGRRETTGKIKGE
ncbi:uncharacterized protein ARB_03422 [Trichophyton benhamiae CBS 112371]|uniref:Uncharacterized protein n=1 Tax=Arthroderma benhamiae (strain ATCC MYA-4681 / CBS 112371) TaxID=663331 RepID=D4B4N2_ARTBC|nr:uncharacterized protein ARB_03422 [Trichophyton benhamiae CBS 112371]EFE30080.1 hypothetical protein ARB_03422 [Trichophyton benhamiae CBS 112371]